MMESFATLLGNVAATLQARQQQRAASYRELVVEVESGKKLKAADVADILEAEGKTVADLAADVELIRKRRAWAADVAAEPACREQQQTAVRALEESRLRYQKACRDLKAAHIAETDQLQADERAAQAGLDRAMTARNKLIETSGLGPQISRVVTNSGNPGMHLNIDSELSRRIERLRASIASKEGKISVNQHVAGLQPRHDPEALERELRSEKAQLLQAEQEFARLQQAHERITGEVARIEAEALTP